MNRVQFAHLEAVGAGTTIACTLNSVAANALIVHSCICGENGTVTVTGVADDLTIAGQLALALNPGGLEHIELWYHKNHGGGTRTFTITFSTSITDRGIVSTEYAGADQTSPLDGTATATGNSATPDTGVLIPEPTVNGCVIVGLVCAQNQPASASPFIDVFQDTTNFCDTEDYVQSTYGPINATWTMTSGLWGAIAAVFKPAVSVDNPFQRSNRNSVPPNVRLG